MRTLMKLNKRFEKQQIDTGRSTMIVNHLLQEIISFREANMRFKQNE